jgi:hypothetical protein
MVRPLELSDPLDAMLGQTRRRLDRAEWVRGLWWKRSHGTLIASRLKWHYNSGLTLEAFSATIYKESHGLGVPFVIHFANVVYCRVDPPASLNVVQSSNDDLEF